MTTLFQLRLSAVVRAWAKRPPTEAPVEIKSRCDACLTPGVVWEKGHKAICWTCATNAIKEHTDDVEGPVHPLHVLLETAGEDWLKEKRAAT